ncbi:MAG: phosphoenolpyruvate--protein phosphotransferase [Chloroflexi bacterium]|nr:phosphoenolpyruvate--protein phosphotransferase [Anaerolineaceae bacterium]NMB86714.1 phosphoenolpyruvate--protein phosphotransferase [Chloroflexota bacterium]
MKQLQGIAASRGVGIGPVFQFRRAELKIESVCVDDVTKELDRFQSAIEVARQQIQEVYNKAKQESSSAQAEIFSAQLLMLDDPEFMGQIRDFIQENNANAESALSKVSQSFTDMLRAMDNEYFAARALDIQDVTNRLLRVLLGVAESPTEGLLQPSVICADDLTPSDTTLLDKRLVIGFCTAFGSATSHTAILARGLGLPAVSGVGKAALDMANGALIILDGNNGTVYIDPEESLVTTFQKRMDAVAVVRKEAFKHAHEPAITLDGKRFEVSSNIGNVEGARKALENGAEGVGLLRTEFLYLERQSLPSEEEQYQAYKQILDLYKEKPVILRTLDVGGDKELPYLEMPEEMNPFLGQRAIRLCFAHPELFKTQLKAALRAGEGNNLWVMFPMVAAAGEVRQARQVLNECIAELKAAGQSYADTARIGIMVEIPSAAVNADQLSKEVDFFSIGTNDLSQYTMAADRTNSLVADLSNAFHPAVLRLIRQTIQSAHARGKWVGMCGELAGEPLAIPVLIGLGLDEFSVNPPMVPFVKQIIRGLNAEEMKSIAQEALELESPEEIKALVKERVAVANIEI